MTRAWRQLRLSGQTLAGQRLRTALCVSATAGGIAGVLVLAAVGEGARREVLAQVDALGRNMLVVTAPPVDARRRVTRRDPVLRAALVAADAEALRRSGPPVVRAAPANDRTLDVRHGRVRNRVSVLATTPEWFAIRGFAFSEGRAFTAAEEAARERVVVLGAQPRALLFPGDSSPVGRTVLIGRVPFRVVGVLEPRGTSASGTATEDDRVVVPFGTAQHRLFGSDAVNALYVEVADRDAGGAAEAEVADRLGGRRVVARREGPPLRVDGQRVLLEARLAAQRPLRRMLLVLGAFSLAVAAVGVMSAMLLSVRERRREIGLRVAVGARRRDVALQFVGESLLLALAGGGLGLALGAGGATMASAFTRWDLRLSAATVVLAAGSTLLVGLASGIAPALRAARLDAVHALSAE